MIDMNKMTGLLDEALSKETTESWSEKEKMFEVDNCSSSEKSLNTEENRPILRDAVFGDEFERNDGVCLIYHGCFDNVHYLIEERNLWHCSYFENGETTYFYSHTNYNIKGRWNRKE